MEELKKVQRVIAKLDHSAPHECCWCWTPAPAECLSQMQQFNSA